MDLSRFRLLVLSTLLTGALATQGLLLALAALGGAPDGEPAPVAFYAMAATQKAKLAVQGGGSGFTFVNDFDYDLTLYDDGTWVLIHLAPGSGGAGGGDNHHAWTGHYYETKPGSGKYLLDIGCPDDLLANAMYFLEEIVPIDDFPWIFTGINSFSGLLTVKDGEGKLKLKTLERGYLGPAPVRFARKIKAVPR